MTVAEAIVKAAELALLGAVVWAVVWAYVKTSQ